MPRQPRVNRIAPGRTRVAGDDELGADQVHERSVVVVPRQPRQDRQRCPGIVESSFGVFEHQPPDRRRLARAGIPEQHQVAVPVDGLLQIIDVFRPRGRGPVEHFEAAREEFRRRKAGKRLHRIARLHVGRDRRVAGLPELIPLHDFPAVVSLQLGELGLGNSGREIGPKAPEYLVQDGVHDFRHQIAAIEDAVLEAIRRVVIGEQTFGLCLRGPLDERENGTSGPEGDCELLADRLTGLIADEQNDDVGPFDSFQIAGDQGPRVRSLLFEDPRIEEAPLLEGSLERLALLEELGNGGADKNGQRWIHGVKAQTIWRSG